MYVYVYTYTHYTQKIFLLKSGKAMSFKNLIRNSQQFPLFRLYFQIKSLICSRCLHFKG